MSAPAIVIPLWIAGLFLFILGVTGSPWGAVTIGLIVSSAGTLLARAGKPPDSDLSEGGGKPHRDVLRSVRIPALLAGTGALAAWIALFDPLPWPLLALLADASIVAATIGVSSLIDWSIVRPRLAGNGLVCGLPCQSSGDDEWRSLTQVWLTQRLVTYAVVRLGLTAAVIFLLVASLDEKLPTGSYTAFGAVSVALFVYFSNRMLPVVKVASNPPFHIGDKITLAEEYSAGVTHRPTYYVVDVAFEGFKVLELVGQRPPFGVTDEDRLRFRQSDFPSDAPATGLAGRSHDRTVALEDVTRLLRNRDAFVGCSERCLRVNPRCTLDHGDPIPAKPVRDEQSGT